MRSLPTLPPSLRGVCADHQRIQIHFSEGDPYRAALFYCPNQLERHRHRSRADGYTEADDRPHRPLNLRAPPTMNVAGVLTNDARSSFKRRCSDTREGVYFYVPEFVSLTAARTRLTPEGRNDVHSLVTHERAPHNRFQATPASPGPARAAQMPGQKQPTITADAGARRAQPSGVHGTPCTGAQAECLN